MDSTVVKPVKAQSVRIELSQVVKDIEGDIIKDDKVLLNEEIEKIQDQPSNKQSTKNCVNVSETLHSAVKKVIKLFFKSLKFSL